MNITYVNKPLQDDAYDPSMWNSQDANEVKTAVNSKADKEDLLLKADITDLAGKANTSALATKADKVNGLVPLAQLPQIYINGGTGSGTQSDPYVFGSGGGLNTSQLIIYLQSLPNFAPDRILQGDMTWIDPPQGGSPQEQLGTPTITFGTATGDSIIINWSTVTFGTNYLLQRSTSNSFASTVNVYSGAGTTVTDLGLSPVTTYYYRLRVSAAGFQASNYGLGTKATDVQGNTTPVAPTLTANDTANTLVASHALGASEIMFSTNNGSYVQYTATISVGNVARAAGYYKFKIKSATGRNESPIVESPAFTVATLPVPATPTSPVTNDSANTFNWTNSSGYTSVGAYEYTLNGGTSYQTVTAKPLVIGDVDLAVGQVGVRVRAVTDVNQVSATLFNTAAFNATSPDLSTPVTSFLRLDNTEIYNTNSIKLQTGLPNGFMVSNLHITPSTTGYIQMSVVKGYPTGHLIVSAGNGNDGESTGGYSIRLTYNSGTGQTQIGVRRRNNFYDFSPSLNTISKVRIRAQDSTLFFEYFTTDWVTQSSEPFSDDLTVKAYLYEAESVLGNGPTNITNLRQFNL